MISVAESLNGNIRGDDRVLKLKIVDGKKPMNSIGMTDPRLFKGGNQLHVILGPNNLWSYRYETGALPPTLRDQRFTTFQSAHNYASDYFKTRNIEIEEVID